VLWCSV